MRHASAALHHEERPLEVHWQLTRARGLTARHASARPRDRDELSLDEARRFLDRCAAFGDGGPELILTGVTRYSDLICVHFFEHTRQLGLRSAVDLASASRVIRDTLCMLAHAGVSTVSVGIDAGSAARHDGLWGVPGSFARALAIASWSRDLGLPVRITTSISQATVEELPAIAELAARLSCQRWTLQFPAFVGRVHATRQLAPERFERLLSWVCWLADSARLTICTENAPQFARVTLERTGRVSPRMRRRFGVRDGRGTLFVSHRGDVYPSAALPLEAGNVRHLDVVSLYRNDRWFRSLRDPARLGGRCGACGYRFVCGGSRARAYQVTGDPFAQDPLCTRGDVAG